MQTSNTTTRLPLHIPEHLASLAAMSSPVSPSPVRMPEYSAYAGCKSICCSFKWNWLNSQLTFHVEQDHRSVSAHQIKQSHSKVASFFSKVEGRGWQDSISQSALPTGLSVLPYILGKTGNDSGTHPSELDQKTLHTNLPSTADTFLRSAVR